MKADKIIFNQNSEINKIHKNQTLKENKWLKINRNLVFFHSIFKIILMNN